MRNFSWKNKYNHECKASQKYEMKFNEQELKAKGFIFRDGAWQKPSLNPMGRLEAGKHDKQARTLDNSIKKKQSSTRSRAKVRRRKKPPEVIVTMTAHLPRYMDDDNLGVALKPVQDALASWMGVDDRDWTVAWEHDQTLTRSVPGVCVVIKRV